MKVNEFLETSLPGIFAVGDVVDGLQLAHVESNEGLSAVANLEAPIVKRSEHVIPRCIYTSPQIASVGKTEQELQRKKSLTKNMYFPLLAMGWHFQ